MSINTVRTRPARIYHTQQVHFLFRRFNFNDIDQSATRPGVFTIGTLPAGALPMETYVRVNTAFTGANVIIGTSAAGSSAVVCSTADVTAGTTGLYVLDRYMGTYSSVDVPLFIQTKASGETVGQADVWQTYLIAGHSTF